MTNLGITFETVQDETVMLCENKGEFFTERPISVGEPVHIEHEIPEYVRANGGNDYVVQAVRDQSARQISWLILKLLQELPAPNRTIMKIDPGEFSEFIITELLLKSFRERTPSLRIWCSPETYRLLRKQVSRNPSSFGSFVFSDLYMSLPVEIHEIPVNEIWLLDPPLWKILMTEPCNDTYYDFKRRSHTYTMDFKMSKPISLGTELIRIQLNIPEEVQPEIVTVVSNKSKLEKEMEKLLDRMRIPNTMPRTDTSVWLRGNPEDDLVVEKIKSAAVQKLAPVLFNPSPPRDEEK